MLCDEFEDLLDSPYTSDGVFLCINLIPCSVASSMRPRVSFAMLEQSHYSAVSSQQKHQTMRVSL